MVVDNKISYITAKELRQRGIDIPKSIPDHAYVQKSSVKAVPIIIDEDKDDKHVAMAVKYQTIISETFKT